METGLAFWASGSHHSTRGITALCGMIDLSEREKKSLRGLAEIED